MANNNRTNILERGLDVLLTKGYNASGVQEIANAAGIPKGSFYNHFPSKEAFGVAVLNTYAVAAFEMFERHLVAEKSAPPLERLTKLFEEWIQSSIEDQAWRGCLVGNLTQEMANASADLRQTVDSIFNRIEGYFCSCLQEAYDRGDIDSDIDVREMSAFLHAAWQGSLLRMKSVQGSQPLLDFQRVVLGKLLKKSVH